MESNYPLPDLEHRFLEHHRALGHSRNTILRYEATFRLFDRFLAETNRPGDSRALTTEGMQRFAVWLRETPVRPHRGSTERAAAGVHGALKDFRAFTRWLTDEGLLMQKVKVPLPTLPRKLFSVLSEKDLERIWSSRYLSGRSSLAIRNRALLGLMLDTGLRRGEVIGLTPADVDLDNCLLTVTGKGNKQRRVPFSTSVRTLLLDWLRVRGDGEDALFWLKAQGLRMVLRRIRDDVGLDLFYAHQLRHTAATALVRNNADPFTVQRILGHADLSTTMRYVSQSVEDLRAKHAAASPFDALLGGKIESPERPRRRRLSLTD